MTQLITNMLIWGITIHQMFGIVIALRYLLKTFEMRPGMVNKMS